MSDDIKKGLLGIVVDETEVSSTVTPIKPFLISSLTIRVLRC